MQSLMVGISGYQLTEKEKATLLHPLVGGVILFSRNYASREQLSQLTASIHALDRTRLLIAVDQEGGRVQRFKNEFTLLPAPKRCGDLYDKDPAEGIKLAESSGELMALELLSSGVDLSFAPVLDIDNGQSRVIGDRAFHHQPKIAGILGRAYISGMKKAGMHAVGKHFPGHGSVINDTHLDSAIDSRPWSEIAENDLLPFIAAIDGGISGIMVAHVIYSQLSALPAGFSKACVSDLLRQKLGFNGAIFSDDMGMMAAKHFANAIVGIQAALEAGCDMVLLCNEPEVIDQALAELKVEANQDRRQRISNIQPREVALSYNELKKSARWQQLRQEIAVAK